MLPGYGGRFPELRLYPDRSRDWATVELSEQGSGGAGCHVPISGIFFSASCLVLVSIWVYTREISGDSCPIISRATASLTPAFLRRLVAVRLEKAGSNIRGFRTEQGQLYSKVEAFGQSNVDLLRKSNLRTNWIYVRKKQFNTTP